MKDKINVFIIIPILFFFFLKGETMGANIKINIIEEGPIASDSAIFIATIYPITTVDTEIIGKSELTEYGYNLWGKPIYDFGYTDYYYFTSSLSYPFTFSYEGINTIIGKLRNFSEIDPESISIKGFPNIPSNEQKDYLEIPKDVVIEEQYISFKIKGWEDVEFMKFPAFVVLTLDKTQCENKTLEDYKKVVSYWREKIEAFSKLEDLQNILGISRISKPFSGIPILTFVSSHIFRTGDFTKRYLMEPEKTKREKLFLDEMSLFSSSNSIYPARLKFKQDLIHEYYPTYAWRIYYSVIPLFYEDEWRFAIHPGGTTVLPGKLSQILRTSLFAHVAMPEFANECKKLDDQLQKEFIDLQSTRTDFFDKFSHKEIRTFHSFLAGKMKDDQKIMHKIDRIEEMLNGYNETLSFMGAPFAMRQSYDFEATENNNNTNLNGDDGLDFFHFQKNAVEHNDRKNADRFKKLIETRLSSIKKSFFRFQEEVSSANSLLENRKNTIENRKNMILSIMIPAAGVFIITLIMFFVMGLKFWD